MASTRARRAPLVVAILLAAALAPLDAAAESGTVTAPADGSGAVDPWLLSTDRLVVVPAPAGLSVATATLSDLADGPATAAGTVGERARVLELPESVPVDEARALAADLVASGVAVSAEPDLRAVPAGIPDDPDWNRLWALSGSLWGQPAYGIDAVGAWDVTLGSPEVVVAIVDTGGTSHPDLDARTVPGADLVTDELVANDGDGRDGDPSDPGDWNHDSAVCPVRSSSWHGTHVAGTVGAVGGNGVGVVGVDRSARLQHVRVLGRCGGSGIDVSDGIRYAAGIPVGDGRGGQLVNATPADVINLSLGGAGSCPSYLATAIADARARGAVVVVAAGNRQDDAGSYWPASCPGVVTVAATSAAGWRAGYSNTGAVVDLAAPGGDGAVDIGIYSTLNSGSTVPASPTYAANQGTSMATPHVSGTLALMRAVAPDLTPDELTAALLSTTTPFPAAPSAASQCSSDPGVDGATARHCGSGIVDAAAAVAAARDLSGAPVVDGVSPGWAAAAGGSAITIVGRHLDGPPQVAVRCGGGDAPATVVAVAPEGSSVQATTPPCPAGLADVVVTTDQGQAVRPAAIEVLDEPTVAGIAPATGSASGGTTVTLTGTGFRAGVTRLTIGGREAVVTGAGTTTLEAVTPAGLVGTADVTVTVAGVVSATAASAFTYTAPPRSDPAPAPFPDLDRGAYYATAVDWAYEVGVTTGVGSTGTYQADGAVTRGQMVAFLHRLADAPGGHAAHGFGDVPTGTFYEPGLRWARATGITTGVGGQPVFHPDGTVTRGQMVTFLWRLAGSPGGHPAHGFGDVPTGTFYEPGLRWARATGITTGVGGQPVFDPEGAVTRGQMAAFLHRLATSPDAWAPGVTPPSTCRF